MTSNQTRASVGHLWLDALVDGLSPFLKPGADMRKVRRLARDYVPGFYPTKLNFGREASWLLPPNGRIDRILRERPRIKAAIECVGEQLAKAPNGPSDRTAKELFKRLKWEIDVPVHGTGLIDERLKWKYDACKRGVAVEVELSSRVAPFKDCFKFLIGRATGQIDVGVVMVRRSRRGCYPSLRSVDPDSHVIFSSLPMLNIAFYGFPTDA